MSQVHRHAESLRIHSPRELYTVYRARYVLRRPAQDSPKSDKVSFDWSCVIQENDYLSVCLAKSLGGLFDICINPRLDLLGSWHFSYWLKVDPKTENQEE